MSSDLAPADAHTAPARGQRRERAGGSPLLPDLTAEPPYRPFESDPGWRESWWWLGIPALLVIAVIVIHQQAPDFYNAWILPEGYGALELVHFFVPLAGLVIAVRLLARRSVRERRPIAALLTLSALACFYIAGEEHSWGQHFFQWQTPDYWANLNRQQETNLHNVNHLFDKTPRLVLELGTFIGGLLIPLVAWFNPRLRRNRWSLFLPAAAMAPTALAALLFKSFHFVEKTFAVLMPVGRPAEVAETFLYLFILFYLIVFARRMNEIEREAAAATE